MLMASLGWIILLTSDEECLTCECSCEIVLGTIVHDACYDCTAVVVGGLSSARDDVDGVCEAFGVVGVPDLWPSFDGNRTMRAELGGSYSWVRDSI